MLFRSPLEAHLWTTQVRLRDPGHLVLPARARSPLPLTRSLQPGQSDADSPIEKAGGDRDQQRPARCWREASARRGSCQKQRELSRQAQLWLGGALCQPLTQHPGRASGATVKMGTWVQTANKVIIIKIIIIIIVTTDSSCARCQTVDQALCTFSLV